MYPVRRIKLLLIVVYSLSFNFLYAQDLETSLVPHIKQIIIEQVKQEESHQLAYKKVQNIAKAAINYSEEHNSTELEDIFIEIEKNLTYEYLKLSRKQVVNLIIKAINS